MSWFKTRTFKTRTAAAVAVMVAASTLAACGFRPLYGQSSANPQSLDELAAINIVRIPDRSGQMMRTALKRRLTPQGARTAAYTLTVTLQETVVKLAVDRSGHASRANLHLVGTYELVRIADEQKVLSGTPKAVASYNVLTSDFATLAAEADARERAIETLADDIQTRLAIYFRGLGAQGSPK